MGNPREGILKKSPPRFPSIKELLPNLEEFSRLHHLFRKNDIHHSIPPVARNAFQHHEKSPLLHTAQ